MSTKDGKSAKKPISQKALAEYLQLSPSTVSLVMNDTPRARLIPEATRQRIFDAAAKFDYRPDFYARYLYSKRSYTIAVVLPTVREQFAAAILAGIDRKLTKDRYLYFIANHHGEEELMRDYPRRLLERAVEGFLFINTPVEEDIGKPAVIIGSQAAREGVSRLALNNQLGGEMAIRHLHELGHRKIAVIKGHPWRKSAAERHEGIARCANELGLALDPRLIIELHSGNTSREATHSEEGYQSTLGLLQTKLPFTALIAFNDVTAIGAMRALRENGLHVPEDVSVIGFDDVESAAYLMPSLTTLRQPFEQMGEMAAERLLQMIESREPVLTDVRVDPTLIVRESTRALVS